MSGFTTDAFTGDGFVVPDLNDPFNFKYNSSSAGTSLSNVKFEEGSTNVNIKVR